MPERDYETLDLILEKLCKEFPDEVLKTFEIGVHRGHTSRGIRDFIKAKGRTHVHTGIDNQHDLKIGSPFPECNFIIGDSKEVYFQLEDNSYHFGLIDGDHSYIGAIADFYAYESKIKVNGYLAFHDTSDYIKQFQDFQHGDKSNPYAYISVRQALLKMGLIPNVITKELPENLLYELGDSNVVYYERRHLRWKMIMDEADETKPTGGITVFQKLF